MVKLKNKRLMIALALIVLALLTLLFIITKRSNRDETELGPANDTSQEGNFVSGGDALGHGVYAPAVLEVQTCQPGRDSIYFGFGHTEFLVTGLKDGNCYFKHGTEIENPEWDGALNVSCKIPIDLDVQLKVSNAGVDFSSIKSYCSEHS